MNLAYRYPIIFWNTANLIVDSDGIDESDAFETYLISEEEEEEDEDEQEKKAKVIDYGRIAAAIGQMKESGITVDLPNINLSNYTFTPDLDNNSIVFGMKGIAKINDTIAKTIIDNRPYSSLEDFQNKIRLAKLPMISLIKSGAFDKIENKPREEIMENYILSIAELKTRLTMQNLPMLVRENLLEDYDFERRVFNFNKYLKKLVYKTIYYELDDKALEFYEANFNMDNTTAVDDKIVISVKVWEKLYKASLEKLKIALKEDKTILDKLNNKLLENVKEKYVSGTISKWEMDSVSFYFNEHELINLDKDKYSVKNFKELPETPQIEDSWTTEDGKTICLYELTRIAGTVINKDKIKNTVTLLTDNGVVNLKIYKTQFAKYDRQISERNEETGKKTVIDKSWFTKGNKLLVGGMRRDNYFIPKVYKRSFFEYPIELITDINQAGEIKVYGERKN